MVAPVYGPLGSQSQTSSTLVPGASAVYDQLRGQTQNAYQGAQAGYQGLLNQGMGLTANFGSTALADIGGRVSQQTAQQDQSLRDRGLGNTSVVNNINTGIAGAGMRAANDVYERANQQRLGVLGQFGSPIYQSMQQGAQAQNQLGMNYMNYLPRQTTQGQSQYGILPGQGGGGGVGGAAGLGPGSTGMLGKNPYTYSDTSSQTSQASPYSGYGYMGGAQATPSGGGQFASGYTPYQNPYSGAQSDGSLAGGQQSGNLPAITGGPADYSSGYGDLAFAGGGDF